MTNRLQALRTLVAVADNRSFSAAARLLHVSPTAVSRAVADLERELGTVLVRRTTRSVNLTPEGEAYLRRCRVALEDLDEAERELRGGKAGPSGLLTITAPVVFGRLHVVPLVAGLLTEHPRLDISLSLTDRIVGLVEESVDVAFRIATLADSALRAVRLGETRRVLAASPAYLDTRPPLTKAADLQDHALIAADRLEPSSKWRFPAARTAVRVRLRMRTDSVEASIDAALGGAGIVRALSYQTDDHVAAGRLVYVLPALDPPSAPINLVFQANRRDAPAVQALIAAAQARLKPPSNADRSLRRQGSFLRKSG